MRCTSTAPAHPPAAQTAAGNGPALPTPPAQCNPTAGSRSDPLLPAGNPRGAAAGAASAQAQAPAPPAPAPAAAPGAAEVRVLEVDAFASVQDLIQAAILANRGAASLKEVRVEGLRAVAARRSLACPPAAGRRSRLQREPSLAQAAALALACSDAAPPRSIPLPHTAPRLFPACVRAQIYAVCQSNGRIAYKRAGGSRLITANDHWKSQIRHALYTGDRFQRCAPRCGRAAAALRCMAQHATARAAQTPSTSLSGRAPATWARLALPACPPPPALRWHPAIP